MSWWLQPLLAVLILLLAQSLPLLLVPRLVLALALPLRWALRTTRVRI